MTIANMPFTHTKKQAKISPKWNYDQPLRIATLHKAWLVTFKVIWHTAVLATEPLQLRAPYYGSLLSHQKEADLPYSQFRQSPKTFLFG